jgi:GMP synthase-like glutamine amidotransferase
MMRVHYIQHVSFEGIGYLEKILSSINAQITSTKLFNSELFQSHNDIDFLIVMGGPMSVNDEKIYPWLKKEKEYIKTCAQSGKPVLGICLGAQLLANSLGARVYRNSRKEIGWFPVIAKGNNNKNVFQFPDVINVFHWHGETFDLPHGSTLIASSKACMNQAFQYGKKAIGLQFHLETTPESAALLVEECGDELVIEKYIQSRDEIILKTDKYSARTHEVLRNVIEYLLITDD